VASSLIGAIDEQIQVSDFSMDGHVPINVSYYQNPWVGSESDFVSALIFDWCASPIASENCTDCRPKLKAIPFGG
jgi:hypothetical protein